MIATPSGEDVHVTSVVKSRMVMSVKVPMAVNCSARPMGSDGLAGVSVIATTTAGVIIKLTSPMMDPKVAPIVVVPTLTPVANPRLPPTLLMVATLGSEEAHVTCVVRSCRLPSEKMPVAVNCWVKPTGSDPGGGGGGVSVISIETRTTGVTERVAVPVMGPIAVLKVALMVVVPSATAVANP
jgi:hypothetical protein